MLSLSIKKDSGNKKPQKQAEDTSLRTKLKWPPLLEQRPEIYKNNT